VPFSTGQNKENAWWQQKKFEPMVAKWRDRSPLTGSHIILKLNKKKEKEKKTLTCKAC
jgi:hypothetical protein